MEEGNDVETLLLSSSLALLSEVATEADEVTNEAKHLVRSIVSIQQRYISPGWRDGDEKTKNIWSAWRKVPARATAWRAVGLIYGFEGIAVGI